MRKVLTLVLCLALAVTAAAAAEENIFETMSGLAWSFSSGVGAWSTDLQIGPDGSFTGDFHDSDMGDTGDGYPDGTVYFCSFSGRMSLAEQVDDYCRKIRVDKLDVEPGEDTVSDGVRFIHSGAYGISEGDEMLLYAPGTPAGILSDEMRLWAHVSDQETTQSELENWFLCSEKNGSGFVGYWILFTPNPWEDMTAEGLKAASGLSFGVPDGAEDVLYRYLRNEGLAEMQFAIGGDEFCARMRSAAEPTDISGMYFDWVNTEAVNIGQCAGTIGQAQYGSEDWVELCMWYDADLMRTYSLSVYTTDPDGLDLTALAEQVSRQP